MTATHPSLSTLTKNAHVTIENSVSFLANADVTPYAFVAKHATSTYDLQGGVTI